MSDPQFHTLLPIGTQLMLRRSVRSAPTQEMKISRIDHAAGIARNQAERFEAARRELLTIKSRRAAKEVL